MMTGRETPNKSTDRQCKHCGLYYSRRGIITHERNCDLQELDGTIIPLDESPDEDAGDVETTDVDPSPEPTQTNDPTPATDGGAQPPPEPDYIPAGPGISDDEDDLDELPEHMVEVGQYLDDARARGLSNEDAELLETVLEEYDVVDTEETTADHIAAYERSEV